VFAGRNAPLEIVHCVADVYKDTCPVGHVSNFVCGIVAAVEEIQTERIHTCRDTGNVPAVIHPRAFDGITTVLVKRQFAKCPVRGISKPPEYNHSL
jgi:hypothetical protein